MNRVIVAVCGVLVGCAIEHEQASFSTEDAGDSALVESLQASPQADAHHEQKGSAEHDSDVESARLDAQDELHVDVLHPLDARGEPSPDSTSAPDSHVETHDAAQESFPKWCPDGMSYVPNGSDSQSFCIDTHELTWDEYDPWSTTNDAQVPGNSQWCNNGGPYARDDEHALLMWCDANQWCEKHGKTLCGDDKWAAACGKNFTPDGAEPQWLKGCKTAQDGPTVYLQCSVGEWLQCSDTLVHQGARHRVRCCSW